MDQYNTSNVLSLCSIGSFQLDANIHDVTIKNCIELSFLKNGLRSFFKYNITQTEADVNTFYAGAYPMESWTHVLWCYWGPGVE